MSSRYRRVLSVFVIAGLATTACRGRIIGKASTVIAADGKPASLAGAPVYLVPATSTVVTRVAAACESTMALVASRGLHSRRQSVSSPLSTDSARSSAEFARSPERLVPTLAQATVQIDAANRFAFERVAPGRYFVVAPTVGWAGVEVRHDTKTVSLTVNSTGACTAVGATSWWR